MPWTDVRPIVTEFVCSGGAGPEWGVNNPRHYLGDSALVVSDTSVFRARMLERAALIVPTMEDLDAQGVVIWDQDGIGHGLFDDGTGDGDFTYVGRPSAIPTWSPEWHAVADDFYQYFTSRGFRVGCTIRPQTFGFGTALPPLSDPVGVYVKTDNVYGKRFHSRDRLGYTLKTAARQYTGPWKQGGAYDPALGLTNPAVNWNGAGGDTAANKQHHLSETDGKQKLLDEIAYCKARWGMTIFYIDTNINLDGSPLNSAVFDAIHAAHPDVLLLPEWEYVFQPGGGYYASTVPYNEAQQSYAEANYKTPETAIYEVPDAKTFVALKDLPRSVFDSIKPVMARQLKDGHLILGVQWWQVGADGDVAYAQELKTLADSLPVDTAPTPGTLLTGTTYTVSSVYGGYTGHLGTGAGMRDGLDNSAASIWAASGGGGGWIRANLGSEQPVTRLLLRQAGTFDSWQDTHLNGVEVWYRAGAGAWTRKGVLGGSQAGVDVQFDMDDTTASEVELRKSTWFGLSEFKVYSGAVIEPPPPPPPPSTTVLLDTGTTYTVSSVYDGYTGHAGAGAGMRDALDDAANTVWAAADGSGGSIRANLGSNKTVDHLALRQNGTFDGWQDTHLSGVEVWYRPAGGGAWTLKGTIGGSTAGVDVVFDMGSVTAAEVELRRANWFGVSRFAVYVVGVAPPAPPPSPPPPPAPPSPPVRLKTKKTTRRGLPKLRLV